MDPLSLLRDFNIKGKLHEVVTQGDRVNFGGQYVFPLSTRTAIQNAAKEYYLLEAILNLLLNRGLTLPEYLKQASVRKIGTVAITDRKRLLDFLDGKLELQLDAPEVLQPSVAASDQAEEPDAKRARLQEEEGAQTSFAALAKQERQLRNRNTMLVAPSKDFRKVIDIANKALSAIKHQAMLQHQQQQRKQQQQQQQAKLGHDRHHHHKSKPDQARPSSAPQQQQTIPVKPSGRFDRDGTTDQLKAMAGEAGAGLANAIDLYGAYNAGPSQQQQEQQQAPPPPPPPPPGSSGQAKAAPPPPPSSSGRPHGHHSSSGKPSSSGRPGSSSGKPDGRSSSQAKPAKAAVPAAPAEKAKGGVPIIIVPSGMTSMLNMFNAKQFLESGRFEPAAVAQQRAGGHKHSLLLVTRTAGKPPGSPGVPYHVVDKAPAKGSEDWSRVVAVVTQGAKWQFKDWPYKGVNEGDLSQVFTNVCGLFLHYADEKVPDTVANWNVRRLGLHRENRHLDMTVLLELYRYLDTFLMSKKEKAQHLAY